MEELSLHILDIMQNSVAAGAKLIQLSIEADGEKLRFVIEDNGCGMSSDMVRKVTDPFTTTRKTRKVGLGLPLLMESAKMSGGSMGIASEQGKGTRVEATFEIGNIDRPPLGDIASTVTDTVITSEEIDFEVLFKAGIKLFRFDTREIKERLGEVPISEFEIASWIREYLEEAVKEIFGGVLDEVDC